MRFAPDRRAFLAGFLAASFVAGPALSQVSERYTCETSRVCDGAGACREASGATVFELDPRNVNKHGEGTYTLRYDDLRVEAYSLTAIGPVVWSAGQNDLQLLSLTGEDTALWQASDVNTGRSVIKFMRCVE